MPSLLPSSYIKVTILITVVMLFLFEKYKQYIFNSIPPFYIKGSILETLPCRVLCASTYLLQITLRGNHCCPKDSSLPAPPLSLANAFAVVAGTLLRRPLPCWFEQERLWRCLLCVPEGLPLFAGCLLGSLCLLSWGRSWALRTRLPHARQSARD